MAHNLLDPKFFCGNLCQAKKQLMAIHPEMNEGFLGEIMREIESHETVDVWCTGCNTWTKMNANYAKYLQGEVESCSKCR
tara:strand:- start:2741 stop:2980 length:240 start_codon:yes stop_codon:yes gene_type:complete